MLASAIEHEPIARIAAPTRREFERRFVSTRTPVVLTGLISEWPALRSWSTEYFARKWSDENVASLATRDGVLDIDERRTAVFSKIRFGEQLEVLRTGRPSQRYVTAPTERMPADFQRDVVTPRYCEGATHLRSRFWLARAGTVTPLHRDLPHNLSAQVFGRKRWLLYPPSAAVYPCRPWSRAPNFARVDPEAPDLQRFPLFADARPASCVLEPGEVLFIPHLWWHHVRSLDDNAAVNFWFGGRVIAALGRASLALKRARALYRDEWE